MHANDENSVLDICQLREITLEDEELMRELLACLVDDTASQLVLLDQAIRDRDPQRTKRIAHYSKGACANVGANALAAQLNRLELHAAAGRFDECAASVQILAREIDRLRTEAAEV